MKCIFKKIAFCSLAASLSVSAAFAQKNKTPLNDQYSKFHLGLGAGLDYGGLGFKAEYLPVKYLGLFGSVGYNFRDPGLNAGVQFRPLPDAKFEPFLIAMYGYNATITVKGDKYLLDQYGLGGINKTYYGFTTGIGGELKVGRQKNRLYFGLLLPFRSKEFKDNYDIFKNNPYLQKKTEILPIGISIGFNWTI